MATSFAILPNEIKQVIFEFISHHASKETLFNASLVCKSWYGQCIQLMWSEVTLKAIWHIRNSRNAGFYLSTIRSLVFGLGDARYHNDIINVFKHPRLPNLEKISFVPGVIVKNDSLDYIIPYLQPSLLTFCSMGGSISMDLLSALKETCTHLEDFRLKFPLKNLTNMIDFDGFYGWLQEMPSICALTVFSGGNVEVNTVPFVLERLLSKSAFRSLLQRPFRRLCLEYGVDTRQEFDTRSISSTMQELSLIVKPDVIPRLKGLGCLQKLYLRVDGDYPEDVLSPICSLLELKSLKIVFTTPKKLKADKVLALKELVKLEALDIRSGQRNTIGDRSLRNYRPIEIVPSFDENDFDDLASSLLNIRHVCLMFDWQPKSVHVLSSAAFYWSNVECLFLGYNIDICESLALSKGDKPLFPYLRKLSQVRHLLTDITGTFDDNSITENRPLYEEYISKVVKNLRHGFPALEDIQIDSDYTYSHIARDVESMWSSKGKAWTWNCYRLDWCWEFEEYFETH